ncbi:MAG: undecaprenyl/decaprenyl-phosphate alpha-N-acetylglucosaminyl 1-phosphate transferase [Bacteroidales bacterium]|nr:undecaprenyl/decaprenyl-phosphate alpha-N-acetylglucosaminyl 1-phosphate transferase [Bacteroidales bacterium]
MDARTLLLIVINAAVASFCTVRWVYFYLLIIAKQKNLVDNPGSRKLQKLPIPNVGGIAVFFGIVSGVMIGSVMCGILDVEKNTTMLPVFAAMVMMLYVGALDDTVGLSPWHRIFIEVIAVLSLIYASGNCIDTFHGLWGIDSFSWWLAVPLTVFVGVGIINSVNMIDGINGLSSAMCMVVAILYGSFFVRSGDVTNAVLAFSAATSLFPFFIHNVFGSHSRMFIGDAGTMVMGLLMTWFTISLLSSDVPMSTYYDADVVNPIAYAIAVLCVPVFDVIRVFAMRILRGGSPFKPDRTHIHHIFLDVRASHIVITLIFLVAMLTVVLIWFVSTLLGASFEMQLYIAIGSSMLIVWGSYFFMSYGIKHNTKFVQKLAEFNDRHIRKRPLWWKRFSEWLDIPEARLNERIERRNRKKQ